MALVYGDAAEMPKFREVLEEVLEDIIEGELKDVDRQPEFSAAKGVAEMAKRAIFSQKQELDRVSEI